jgi:RimJ/RimL family protein N-acetyltransferase
MAYLIKSKRVNLRTLRESDADSITRYAGDRSVSAGTFVPHPYKTDDALAFIRFTRKLARRKQQTSIGLGIEYNETGEIIGGIGIHRINYAMRNAEVGYWIGKPYRGTGLMVEAMQAMLRFAFGDLKLKRVYAQVFVENIASQKLVEKCGFTLEGRLRSTHWHHKRWRTCYMYSILREEFRPRRVA